MKLKTRCKRILSLLTAGVSAITFLFSSVSVAFAWQAEEGVTCSSRFGRSLVGADGQNFYTPSSYPVLIYDENGNTSVKTATTTGKPQAYLYLYTEYNVDEHYAYCLESGVTFGASTGGYSSLNSSNSRFFQNLPRSAQIGIMLASVYGAHAGKPLPISGINTDDYYFATQIIIWEYQQQLRKSPTRIENNGQIPWDLYYNQLKGHSAELAYNWILEQMEKHSKIPSFSSRESYEATEHIMKYNPATKQYSITLTDANNSGVDFTALSNTSGITVTRSGNRYTFTTSNIIDSPVNIKYKKDLPVYGEPFLVWGRPGYQAMCSGVDDPVQFFIKFKTESVGTLDLIKKSEPGISVEGWEFNIKGNGIDKNVSVDSSGHLSVPGLVAGKYTISEINLPEYMVTPPAQEVTILPGQTTFVEFNNQLKRAALLIYKESYNGKNLEGIPFLVKGTTEAGTSWEHTYYTDSNGIVDVKETDADAPPVGSYTVSELESNVNIGYILPTSKNAVFTYGTTTELHFYNAPKMGSLKVIKTDDLNNHFVEGVPFRLKGTSYSGDEVDITVKTNKEGVAEFLEIPIGNFLLYENDVPAFFVTPDPEEVKVIYAQTNEENIQNIAKRTQLNIIKTSTDMKNVAGIPFRIVGIPLAGQEFAVDEVYYTDENGKISVDLLIGNYSIIELDSNTTIGYIKPESQNVTLEYGSPETVQFFNKLIQNDIKLVKTDEFDDKPMEGIPFGLFDAEGNLIARGETDQNGELVFKDVGYGKGYYIQELEHEQSGYILSDPILFDVSEDGITQEFVFENKREPCKIGIWKNDRYNNEPLSGVPFGLFGAETGNLIQSGKTDDKGLLYFDSDDIVWGMTVEIRELEPLAGYLPCEPIEVTINRGDDLIELEIVNQRTPCDIQAFKTNGITKAPLPHAIFGLYDENGVLIEQQESDENGYLAFTPQVWGQKLQIREIRAPEGYQISEQIMDFELKAGDNLEFYFENFPVEDSPKTGDDFLIMPLILLAIACGAAIAVFVIYVKRKK